MHSYFIAHEADHRMAERHATASLARRRRSGAPVTRRSLRDIGPAIAGVLSRNLEAQARPAAGPCTSVRAAATRRATV
jgi:hypothetical protein